MKVLLSPKELDACCDAIASRDCPRGEYGIVLCESCAAKTQARHLLKVLQEPCTAHGWPDSCPDGEPFWTSEHRRDCPACMAEIEKELA